MSFYIVLIHIHSVLRWFLLAFLLYSLVISFIRWRASEPLGKTNALMAAITVYFSHLQLLVGIILYFVSVKVMFNQAAMASPVIRFFTVEHVSLMVLAIASLTFGNIKAKSTDDQKLKAKHIFVWFLIGFIIMMLAIPWPFRALGSGWM